MKQRTKQLQQDQQGSHVSRKQQTRLRDVGSETTCSSSASKRDGERESKGPGPRGNSVSSKESRKDEGQRLEKSARAQLCYPSQIHRKATSC